MSIPFFQIDAFTNKPFGGNSAAVCLLSNPGKSVWMQNVAAEMNLSETAFLHRQKEGYSLRWFTPTTEVDLCGHATLAATQALYELGYVTDNKPITFFTKSGALTATKTKDMIELNFPIEPAEPTDTPPPYLLEALGVNATFVGKNRFDYLIEVATVNEVKNLDPDFNQLKKLKLRGVMVTAKSNSQQCDFVSRFFAPGAGINEDPVTGSAHCCLGPYWATKLGKTKLVAHQISQRKGELFLQLSDNRIFIRGHAVTVLQGELRA